MFGVDERWDYSRVSYKLSRELLFSEAGHPEDNRGDVVSYEIGRSRDGRRLWRLYLQLHSGIAVGSVWDGPPKAEK